MANILHFNPIFPPKSIPGNLALKRQNIGKSTCESTFWLGFCQTALMLVPNLLLLIFLWVSNPNSVDSVAQIDPVVAAIQVGSSSDLAKFFNPSIALNINGQQGDYSRNQAEIILKDFFKKNPPLGFSLVFKNENTSTVSTYIGEYASGQIQFKVFIKISQADNLFRIYSLDFVKS